MTQAPVDANAACVGPESENAGKVDSCQGCPNKDACASGQALLPDPAIPLINKAMEKVDKKILVLSGKGGVGKSTFSTNLSWMLSNNTFMDVQQLSQQQQECTVGLLDLDITGPSLPTMLGCLGEQVHQSNSGWSPVYVSDTLSLMSIGFMLPNPDEAVIWKGPKKNGLIKQFLKDVDWGPLDYLIVDTPPGTSDEHLSIVQYLKETGINGAIIVTTPQELALQDVRKEINFCKKVGVKILGVVENMSGFVCPKCTIESKIFAPSSGGARRMCLDMNVPFLGSIPIDPRIAKSCDLGQCLFEEYKEIKSPAIDAYADIVRKIRLNFK